jgi:hypothetical protein
MLTSKMSGIAAILVAAAFFLPPPVFCTYSIVEVTETAHHDSQPVDHPAARFGRL